MPRRITWLIAVALLLVVAFAGGALLTTAPGDPCLFTYPDEIRLPQTKTPIDVKFQVVLSQACRDRYGAPISEDPANSYMYFWVFGDGKSASTTSSSITHAYADYGNYVVSLRIQAKTGYTEWSRGIELLPPRVLAGDIIVTGTGKTLTFTANITQGTSPFSYVWFVDGQIRAGQTAESMTYTFPAPGTYRVQVEIHDRFGETNAGTEVTVSQSAPPQDDPFTPAPSIFDNFEPTELPLLYIILGGAVAVFVAVFLIRRRLF